MKSRILFASLTFLLLIPAAALSQTASPTPPDDDKSAIRISTTLIQVDATVTDRSGRIVTDLRAEDFEIYENGRKQEITNFSFVAVQPPAAAATLAAPERNKAAVPIPPARLKNEQVRRAYALVVDDLGLSFPSVYWVQQSLKKFINEQVADGDLVAIVRTGSGIGALQSFTTDKRLLLAAVDKLRWNPLSRGGTDVFEPLTATLKGQLSGQTDGDGNEKSVVGRTEEEEFLKEFQNFRNENFAIGTLGALNYVIRGMKELPGRKSLIVFSDGFPLYTRENGNRQPTQILDRLRVLADLANRASVVIYTLDPRGLDVGGSLLAQDQTWDARVGTFGGGGDTLTDKLEERNSQFVDSQQSLRYLAFETGGVPFVNQNDLNKGLERVLADQQGYYLLGYQPDETAFDPQKARFNKLVIKVKNPELRVRYRSGFFGITDEKLDAAPVGPQQKLSAALTSPFNSSGVNLSLYPLYMNDAKTGDLIRALVYIDVNDLRFEPQADGKRRANFDLLAMTFGDNGQPIGQLSKNYTIDLPEDVYRNAVRNGLVYDLTVPVKKAGAYQFRVALRDTAADVVGSASQFIEVPNLKKNRLALSNLILDNFPAADWARVRRGETLAESGRSAFLDTTRRQFRRGTVLRYGYVVYNAPTDGGRLRPVNLQTRLIRDGRVVLETPIAPFDATGQTDLRRLETTGAITLGGDLTPGSYVLQVIASDPAAKGKNSFAAQWIDFEIVP